MEGLEFLSRTDADTGPSRFRINFLQFELGAGAGVGTGVGAVVVGAGVGEGFTLPMISACSSVCTKCDL